MTMTTATAIDLVDARFQQRRQQVPVLAQRAEAEGITSLRSLEELVPLLFPHTTYKSYPEALVSQGRWAQLNRWLDSLSTHRVAVDIEGVADVDGWITRLEAAGHLVSSSSGTSGKASFLNKSIGDRSVSMQNMLDCMSAIGLPPGCEWNVIATGPETGVAAHAVMRDLLLGSYARPDGIALPTAQAAGGHHRYMSRLAAMRRAMADGTASPDEVATFEAAAAERQRHTDERLQYYADQLLERRSERMLFTSMLPLLYRLTQILREKDARPGDLTGANALTTGGGLKGSALPPDHREQCFAMLSIDDSRFMHYYSMQELNLRMLKCPEQGHYHVPDELVLLVLDRDGEQLAPVSDGQVEGRAAFFDLTVDGRWGGTISGDKVLADLDGCRCGRPGPTVHDQITRYSDLADGDKITCAGTMDAYVRGFVED
ncbi:MAG: hypothetical protein ABR549_09125 [Mycobacteriales bacterium]